METYILFVLVLLFLYWLLYWKLQRREEFIYASEINGNGDNLPTDVLFNKQKLSTCECIEPGYVYVLDDDYKLTGHIACIDVLR